MGEKKNEEKLKRLKCSECNTEIHEGDKICFNCGTPVPKIADQLEEMKSMCPKCYAEFGSEISICKECGTKTIKIASKSHKTVCPWCFSEIEPGLIYCPECGSKTKRYEPLNWPKQYIPPWNNHFL